LLGNLINWGLYGVLTVQIYLYYLAFPKDRRWTKAVVHTIYGLEGIHTICLTYELVMVVGLNKPAVPILGGVFITTLLAPLVLGIVGTISQCLYANRIFVITQSKVTPIIICPVNTYSKKLM
ncbi:hypothetical protein AMATHDRAFT_143337, partial [Amanita thiersii Skay4041]